MLCDEEIRVKGAVNTRDTSKCGRASHLVLFRQAADGGASLTLVSHGRWASVWRPDIICQASTHPCSSLALVTHICIFKNTTCLRKLLRLDFFVFCFLPHLFSSCFHLIQTNYFLLILMFLTVWPMLSGFESVI